MSKQLFTLTGPSCSGKTTLIRKLLHTGKFCEVVSFTTRKPRFGEVHEVDYNFVNHETAQSWIDADETAEHIRFKEQIYGIHKSEIEKKLFSDQTPIVIVEPNGLSQLRRKFDVFSIYVDSPIEVLYSRFLTRFKENPNADIDYEARRALSIYMEWKTWSDEKVDLYIKEFNEFNEQEVIASICDEILKKDNG